MEEVQELQIMIKMDQMEPLQVQHLILRQVLVLLER